MKSDFEAHRLECDTVEEERNKLQKTLEEVSDIIDQIKDMTSYLWLYTYFD